MHDTEPGQAMCANKRQRRQFFGTYLGMRGPCVLDIALTTTGCIGLLAMDTLPKVSNGYSTYASTPVLWSLGLGTSATVPGLEIDHRTVEVDCDFYYWCRKWLQFQLAFVMICARESVEVLVLALWGRSGDPHTPQ